MAAPKTLMDAIQYFGDPDRCHALMVQARWRNGVMCPTCGSRSVRYIRTRRLWVCKGLHSRQQFSVKIGTIFEDSPLGLDKWFTAMWMICNDKNGISSYEVARALGITQKSAWFMMHRIREAMHSGTFERMRGRVEIDETYIGGAARFMHKRKKEQRIKGTARYLDEEVFRFNQRRDAKGDSGRFVRMLHSVTGRRLDYKTLTGKMLGLSLA